MQHIFNLLKFDAVVNILIFNLSLTFNLNINIIKINTGFKINK